MRKLILSAALILFVATASAAEKKPKEAPPFPPRLPGGERVVTDRSEEFLRSPVELREGVEIAETPPTIDFLYFPGQNWPGHPWSNWGDSLAVEGKYYAAIGDHLAPQGHPFVYEYDPATKELKQLLDVTALLDLPEGHYAPGKIHSRIDLGRDGRLYFSTHRGSTRVTTDEYHYRGDWIIRLNPESGEAEVVVQGPVPKHCIPTSVLDPERLIFYGGTAPGEGDPSDIRFFAYDVPHQKLLYSGPDGPARYMIFAASTGRVYYTQGKASHGQLMRFDPDAGKPVPIAGRIGIRAATQETPGHIVYTVSTGQGDNEATLYAFDTQTEKIKPLGPAAVGSQDYITSLDADPTGRYLYYMPGAHGGSDKDGAPVVQFDTQTGTRKVIAFLAPFYTKHHACTPVGTYSSALSPDGATLNITWNTRRPGTRHWDCCALSVVHIPESERRP
jgi:hypothetical protein